MHWTVLSDTPPGHCQTAVSLATMATLPFHHPPLCLLERKFLSPKSSKLFFVLSSPSFRQKVLRSRCPPPGVCCVCCVCVWLCVCTKNKRRDGRGRGCPLCCGSRLGCSDEPRQRSHTSSSSPTGRLAEVQCRRKDCGTIAASCCCCCCPEVLAAVAL